jgi:hypothetical protein
MSEYVDPVQQTSTMRHREETIHRQRCRNDRAPHVSGTNGRRCDMARAGTTAAGWGAVSAVLLLALVPSTAGAVTQLQKKRGTRSFALTAPLGSFTPAAADPRAAATFARAGIDASGFRFTPSAAPGSRRAVTVAVRARSRAPVEAANRLALAQPVVTPITPMAYNMGISVGWKRFAITGDLVKVDNGMMPGGRESADVALSYGGRKWSGRLALAAERPATVIDRLVDPDESYSADLGGSYSLTRNLDVTGGIRYRIQRDRVEPLADLRRDSQAVYLGTAFRF